MAVYLAHSPTADCPDGQPLKDHLENVAALSKAFARSYGPRDAYLCGLYHDIGKYSQAFQRHLSGSPQRVDHSSAGALTLFERRNLPAAICIAGHHAGLADCGTRNDLADTFMARINHARDGGVEDFSAWKQELPDGIPAGGQMLPGVEMYFYTKMLFSALTDADWLDTDAYFRNRPYIPRCINLNALRRGLDEYIAPWWEAKNDVNLRRCAILRAAIEHGGDAPGIFTMTVPACGGKTVSSMAFALHHAAVHGKKRVIYVIPYCSILEQTQRVFEGIFGPESITAHYSGAEYAYGEDEPDIRAFSAENWEAPIILTTAVQFFESLFSNRPGKSRKIHNIADSVIVFDEAQMLPVPYLRPCVAAICQLAAHYGCSAVLCTATQPVLDPLLLEFLPEQEIRELCPQREKMYQDFRRVRYTDEGLLTDEELAERLQKCRQVLCIVNSRRQAQELYRALEGEAGSFHLSTAMTPHDRKAALDAIRLRLDSGQDCRVISTSLIEAGVDVDFPEVYRALAGLDSVIQAGGRCNREGKRPAEDSVVHIFRTEAKAPRMLEQNIAAAARTLHSFREPDSPEAIRAYFQFLLYTLKDDGQLDEKGILRDAKDLRFATVAENFHIIEGADDVIYVPTCEGAALVERLRRDGPTRELLRRLGQYSVSVYRDDFRQLVACGAVEQVADNAGILLDMTRYSSETGISFTVSEQNQVLYV